eukprot:gb/GEZN01019958.1/.p1 GENE.gb/GEZN01019958.1/~~gb/GEZN01019958.1/.p1  ORF type:complete len:204 (-),score=19.97 gb/GEZN01019958.1/:1-612(-)
MADSSQCALGGCTCPARVLTKPGGKEIPLAKPCLLKHLAGQAGTMVVDVRDPNEVEKSRGYERAVNVPLNKEGLQQSVHKTTLKEFQAKLAGKIPPPPATNQALLVHCGSGGRASSAVQFLKSLGYTNVHNAGSPPAAKLAFEQAQAIRSGGHQTITEKTEKVKSEKVVEGGGQKRRKLMTIVVCGVVIVAAVAIVRQTSKKQ